MSVPTLTPRLICRDTDAAIAFYRQVFGAELLERYAAPDGRVVHAALALGSAVLALAEEHPDRDNVAPATLGGSGVLLQLEVPDPDAVERRAVAAGARVVFPVADQFYGRREGRLEDPFGHRWIVGRELEALDPETIQRGVDRFERGPTTDPE